MSERRTRSAYFRAKAVVDRFQLIDLPRQIVGLVALPFLDDAATGSDDILHVRLDIRQCFVQFLDDVPHPLECDQSEASDVELTRQFSNWL